MLGCRSHLFKTPSPQGAVLNFPSLPWDCYLTLSCSKPRVHTLYYNHLCFYGSLTIVKEQFMKLLAHGISSLNLNNNMDSIVFTLIYKLRNWNSV